MTSATAAEFDRHTSERAVAEFVNWVGLHPQERDALVQLLDERQPLFLERSANEVARIRGRILAAFERTGLPESAVPYVAEELQTGMQAYPVAAAARAIRGLPRPIESLTPLLLKAIGNIGSADDTVSFDDSPRPSTALREIFETLAWMGPYAHSGLAFVDELLENALDRFPDSLVPAIRVARDRMAGTIEQPSRSSCCSRTPVLPHAVAAESCSHVIVQDQDGQSLQFQEFVAGKPTVVAFFYTRCDNPQKCSLTIAKLAELQTGIRSLGLHGSVRITAITYDPEFDLPQRLRAYGEIRGFTFDADNRMLRVTEGFDIIQQYFRLGVNFVGTIVNRHQLEVYVLDALGKIAYSHTRLQWEPADLIEVVASMLPTRGDET